MKKKSYLFNILSISKLCGIAKISGMQHKITVTNLLYLMVFFYLTLLTILYRCIILSRIIARIILMQKSELTWQKKKKCRMQMSRITVTNLLYLIVFFWFSMCISNNTSYHKIKQMLRSVNVKVYWFLPLCFLFSFLSQFSRYLRCWKIEPELWISLTQVHL